MLSVLYFIGMVNLCSASDLSTGQAGSSGYINSPGYPEDITAHASGAAPCRMHVTSSPDCHTRLQFKEVALPGCSQPVPTEAECIPGYVLRGW